MCIRDRYAYLILKTMRNIETDKFNKTEQNIKIRQARFIDWIFRRLNVTRMKCRNCVISYCILNPDVTMKIIHRLYSTLNRLTEKDFCLSRSRI